MTLLCFASQKGSPGTSAAALAIAAALRPGEGRRKLLLEADIAGGALAVRYRLPVEPGLVTLAAAARAGLDDDDLWRHTVELPGGLPAVVCPDGPDRVHAALAAAGRPLGRYLAGLNDVDVICDIGRLPVGSPAEELVSEATALLMVARPAAEQLQPAARRLMALRPSTRNVGWLLIGERPYGPAEVEETFGFPVVGVLADDRRSVEAIESGELSKRVRRHPFIRSAVTVADILADWLAPMTVPSTTADPVPPAEPEPPTAPEPPIATGEPSVGVVAAESFPPMGDTAPEVDPVGSDPEPIEPVPLDLTSLPPPDADIALERIGEALAEPVPLPVDRTPAPATASAPVADIRPAVVGDDEDQRPSQPPSPFVHGDDDIEWTAS